MSDTHAMAALRNELLNTLYNRFPAPVDRNQLLSDCRIPFLCRDKQWYADALAEQLKVLGNAGLIRPMHGGYVLTDRGRQDRQQAARFFNNKPPQDAA